MPRRPGGGRKPDDVVLPFRPKPDVAQLKDPPEGLTDAQQLHWRRLAPLALEQGTLVEATGPGFRELCELLALKDELWAKLARFGSESKSGLERMRSYTRLSARVDSALARFKLTAFGKPAARQAESKKANPFAGLGDPA